jgi:uncharacterized protein YfeS
MFWGNFIQSLIIVSIAGLVEFDRNEASAYFQITNELAILNSFNSASALIVSFLRWVIIMKREKALLGDDVKYQQGVGAKRAEFRMKQLAKQFRQDNTQLMMTNSKVPIDTLIQNVFVSVDTNLQNVKDSVFTSTEMEKVLTEVENDQINLELQIKEMRNMNSEVLKALGLEMPTIEQLNNQISPLTGGNSQQPGADIAMHQFTYKGRIAGGGQVIRNTTMQARNQGYHNNAAPAEGPTSGFPYGVSPQS